MALNQCWFDAGPPSATMAQHQINICSRPRVRLEWIMMFDVVFHTDLEAGTGRAHLASIAEEPSADRGQPYYLTLLYESTQPEQSMEEDEDSTMRLVK